MIKTKTPPAGVEEEVDGEPTRRRTPVLLADVEENDEAVVVELREGAIKTAEPKWLAVVVGEERRRLVTRLRLVAAEVVVVIKGEEGDWPFTIAAISSSTIIPIVPATTTTMAVIVLVMPALA